MKNKIGNSYLIWSFLCILVLLVMDVQAQNKPQTKAKVQTKKTTNTKGGATKKTTQVSKIDSVNAGLDAKARDTALPMLVVAKKKFTLNIDTPRKPLRNDGAITPYPNNERKPLGYEHIREDDVLFLQRVWREIDVQEKMNMPFRYKADNENGNQRFIMILLGALNSEKVKAFHASIDGKTDDQFTKEMTLEEISERLASKKCDTMPRKRQRADGSIYYDTVAVCEEFNPDDVVKYRIKEEWVFDKESSRMYARILGIAPVKAYKINDTLSVEAPMFWLYYPDLRPLLVNTPVYNPKNAGARISWDELFEYRYFSSNIIKSKIDNPSDLEVRGLVADDYRRLLEGEKLKEKIFNYEQNLWNH